MGNGNCDGFATMMNRAGTVVIPMLCTEDINDLLDGSPAHPESMSKSPFSTLSKTPR